MKTHAALLTLGLALTSQVCLAGRDINDVYVFQSPPSVAIGELPGKTGGAYVVLYGSRDADPGRLVAKRSNSVFTEDVDRDGFADLVLLGTVAAVGDANGDAIPDVLITPDEGGGPRVRVFSYQPGFHGGVFVAVGDIDGDGFAEIIVSPDMGGGARVGEHAIAGAVVKIN